MDAPEKCLFRLSEPSKPAEVAHLSLLRTSSSPGGGQCRTPLPPGGNRSCPLQELPRLLCGYQAVRLMSKNVLTWRESPGTWVSYLGTDPRERGKHTWLPEGLLEAKRKPCLTLNEGQLHGFPKPMEERTPQYREVGMLLRFILRGQKTHQGLHSMRGPRGHTVPHGHRACTGQGGLHHSAACPCRPARTG